MTPLSGKQKWSCRSSQPTPRSSNYYVLWNHCACLLNNIDKIQSMRHLLHQQINSPSIVGLVLAWWKNFFIVFFPGLGHLWASYSLALHREFLTIFLGICLLHHLSSHSPYFTIFHFPLWVNKHSFNDYFSSDSYEYFNYSIIIIHSFILNLLSKYLKNKYSK